MTSKEEFVKNLMKGIDARFRLKEFQRKKRIEQQRQQENDYLYFKISSFNRIRAGVR